jgi:hypothetical protein
MYDIQIKTKFNVIQISVDDLEDPEVKEILEQPWVEEIKVDNVQDKPKYKKLIRRNNERSR